MPARPCSYEFVVGRQHQEPRLFAPGGARPSAVASAPLEYNAVDMLEVCLCVDTVYASRNEPSDTGEEYLSQSFPEVSWHRLPAWNLRSTPKHGVLSATRNGHA